MSMLARTMKRRAIIFCFALALLTSCSSAPQFITVSSRAPAVEPPAYGSKDYPRAMAAILTVMGRELKLPAVEVAVTLFLTQVTYEQGVVDDGARDLEQLRKLLGPAAKALREDEFIANVRQTAVSTDAIGKHKRILINEWRLAKYPWPEWIRVLAHELAHTVEFQIADGRPPIWDRWISEGMGEWVGYKVVDAFGAATFAKSREQRLHVMHTARSFQTFPVMSQLATGPNWLSWARTLGREATYGQALFAVELLIERKGLAAVSEYIRQFKSTAAREKVFVSAFGETPAQFDEAFSKHLAVLLGK